MNTQIETRSLRKTTGNALARIFVLCFFAFAISGQAPPNPVPPPENIEASALIIPMDNVNQGNAAGTTFNLRAYGLANLLLQNNIPVKWAIKPGKDKDEADFSANVTRISGTEGVAAGNVSFSGGAFIVSQEYDNPSVRALITTFNGSGTAVTVYHLEANTLIDIRYTLTHKPKIAVGPDGGNFGTGVHQDILDAAGISNYTSVSDDIINENSCYTMATQAHSVDPTFVNLYRNFTQSGGNLLLQCASVGTFENHPNGHFQTTVPGWALFGTNAPANAVDTTLLYPEGSMPFNQFIGALANQDGAVTEYAFAPGAGPANNFRVSVRNSNPHGDKFVATVSQLNGPGSAGGTVFELGGHDYSRDTTGEPLIERLNGLRMFLNAIFVPVTRPTECGLAQANVLGFKSVRRFNVRVGPPALIAGDTLEWTIDYINNSPVDVSNFQIRDVIQANLTLVPGSNVVTLTSGGAVATANGSYDGIGNDSSSDLLAPGAFLPVNGRIQVKVRMVINLGIPAGTVLLNQTVATGSTLVSATSSDNIDATNTNIFGPGQQPPPDSILQPQNPASIDPTRAVIQATPTAAEASINGAVRTGSGMGISGAVVTATNVSTGVSMSARTNSTGNYRITRLDAGELYQVTVSHKTYVFANNSVTFTLSDNVTGLAFVGSLPQTRSSDEGLITSSRLKR